MQRSYISLLALLAVTEGALISSAGAQEKTTANDNTIRLEEITVTARKRRELLQDVPISITAFNADMLDRIGATELVDILHRTPNFYQPYLGEAKGTPPSIRGVVGTSTAGADPAVGFYIDEVYLGNTVASSFDLFDLESFEVLRGPQGTLFGRNTIAGVVNVHTKKPTDKFEGAVSASYGNYNDIRLRGYVSGPIVGDKLYGKVSALFNDRDGFIKNDNPNHGDLRELHNWFVRSQLRLVPTDNTEFLLSFDYRNVDQRGGGYKADGQNVFFSGTIPGTESLTFFPSKPLAYEVNWDCCGQENLKAWGVSLDGKHQFESMELRSITAYREHSYFSIFDTDLSPNHWVSDGSPEDQWQFSQELRLTSTSEGRLSWIAGLFYFHQDSVDKNFVTFEHDILPFLGLPPGTPDQKTQANGAQKSDSYAAYLNITYHLTDQLEIALGGRITHDKKSIDYKQTDPAGLFGGGFTTIDANSWTEFTGDATLSYKWTPEIMTYASIARGYKAGGFNDGVGEADNPPFNPEFVLSYEVGLKSSWLNNRIIFNIDAYYLDWNDIQVAGYRLDTGNSFRRVTGNFGDATSKGIEASAVVRPVKGLELTANFGIQNGQSKATSDNGLVSSSNLTGPDFTSSISALYEHSVGDYGHLTWYTDVVIQGPNDLLPPSSVPAGTVVGPHQSTFGLLNARVTFTPLDSGWQLSLWGKNITNKTYKSQYFSFDGNAILTPGALVLGEPRMYGAEIRLNF